MLCYVNRGSDNILLASYDSFIADIGKEGAMVFKMLKGFGRLMLTTAVLCSVGLFLCGNVVKADDPVAEEVKVNISSDKKFEVKYVNGTGADVTISEVQLTIGDKVFKKGDLAITVENQKTSNVLYSLPLSDVMKDPDANISSYGEIKIKKAVVKYASTDKECDPGKLPAAVPIYTVTVKKAIDSTYSTAINSYALNTFTVGGRNYSTSGSTDYVGYGLEGEEVVIQTKEQKAGGSAVTASNYLECISASAKKWYDVEGGKAVFAEVGTQKVATIGAQNISYIVQYFPKAAVTVDTTGKKVNLNNAGTYTDKIEVPFTYAALSGSDTDKTVIKNAMKFVPVLNGATNIKAFKGEIGDDTKGYLTLGNGGAVLNSDATPGTGNITIKAVSDTGVESPIPVTVTGTKPLTVYAALKDIVLKDVTYASITLFKNEVTTIELVPTPAGADPTIIGRVQNEKFTITDSKKLLDQTNTKMVQVAGKSYIQVTSGKSKTDQKIPATIVYSCTAPETGSEIRVNLDVYVVENTALDEAASIKKINNSDKNYITVGYELDLASLIESNLVTEDGKTVPKESRPKLEYIDWDDTDKADKCVESYKKMTDEADKPSKKLKGKAEGTVTFTANMDDGTTLEGLSVTIYPMPSAKYSTDHKVTVTVPTKVSTGYGDTDTNITSGKGFKLVMEDSSGNTLYEYDKTKYQSVISSPKDFATSYAIVAADIEAMVTNAATNGKFGGDTQVKFKVVPMGYKQGTSSEMIVAKDEVNAKTDGVQVYQLTSTGANFTNSFAYGLDGQTVNLTATPNTGFTFSKWTDGVTSNPRSIKVAGTGTRQFTPEAVEGGAAAGAAGGDNSALYDEVPKTAESNVAIWLIVFMVFAVMGTAYALYLQLRAATSRNGK